MIKAKDEYCHECEGYHPNFIEGCKAATKIILKPKHGGKRKGAGPKQKYSEGTDTVSFRVPKSHISKVNKMVNDYLKPLQLKRPNPPHPDQQ